MLDPFSHALSGALLNHQQLNKPQKISDQIIKLDITLWQHILLITNEAHILEEHFDIPDAVGRLLKKTPNPKIFSCSSLCSWECAVPENIILSLLSGDEIALPEANIKSAAAENAVKEFTCLYWEAAYADARNCPVMAAITFGLPRSVTEALKETGIMDMKAFIARVPRLFRSRYPRPFFRKIRKLYDDQDARKTLAFLKAFLSLQSCLRYEAPYSNYAGELDGLSKFMQRSKRKLTPKDEFFLFQHERGRTKAERTSRLFHDPNEEKSHHMYSMLSSSMSFFMQGLDTTSSLFLSGAPGSSLPNIRKKLCITGFALSKGSEISVFADTGTVAQKFSGRIQEQVILFAYASATRGASPDIDLKAAWSAHRFLCDRCKELAAWERVLDVSVSVRIAWLIPLQKVQVEAACPECGFFQFSLWQADVDKEHLEPRFSECPACRIAAQRRVDALPARARASAKDAFSTADAKKAVRRKKMKATRSAADAEPVPELKT